MFTELNTVALYIERGYSFYIDDNYDIKNSLLCIEGEYSSDYILKSYIKEGNHLAKYMNDYSFIEVIRLNG